MQKTPSGIPAFQEVGLIMWFDKWHSILAHLSGLSNYLPAILVTVGIAVLIGCAVGCVCSPCEEKDDLFHHETL